MRIEIDTEKKTIEVKTSVELEDLYTYLDEHGLETYTLVPSYSIPYSNPYSNGDLTVGAPVNPWYTTSIASVFKCTDEGSSILKGTIV